MNFYDQRAQAMAKEIYTILKEDEKPRGDKLADMFKAMMRLNETVIECAAKLAPYQSAKLESVEIKKTTEHRFVIAAPKVFNNSGNWLDNVNQEAKMLPSAQQIIAKSKETVKTIAKIDEIEEAEIIKQELNQLLEAQ